MHRRRFLSLGAAAVGTAALAACSGPSAPTSGGGSMGDMERIAYGSDPSQFAELTRPSGASRGVVVVIHGGFWRAQYDLSLGRPLAASLAEEGWTAWNLEYRRVGNGGGWPQTPDDVSAGIDKLAEVDGLDLSRVVTLGHSAGGHLAVWAAGRQRLQPWTDAKVPVTAAVSQAGVLDLAGAASLGAGAVEAFLGRPVDQVPDADPTGQVPLDVPVRCVHGRDDSTVPISQSEAYVAAATDAGADATLTPVDGDHFVVIDPRSEAWATTVRLLADL
ncbi:alpha/beta hydrolase [Aeromicrobium sp. REDSEA-S32_B7]|uniref:alpha/beta hydrolase family protein n=2 Tax=Aeromicrobium TaxID=2040 RepID=UPI002954AAE4|nr:alpha/beta hydrolase [Aeromicrobium sp. REDSEA-S32_B7]